MMNMVLSYQYCCMPPMTTGNSLCRVASLRSCTKKTNLCFSTPLLLGRKMSCINIRSSSSSSSSLSSSSSHPLMMMIPWIPSDVKDEDGTSLCRFYDYVNEKFVNTNTKIPDEVNNAICLGSSLGWLAYASPRDCSVFLWSPFTTSPLISLPPIHTLPFIKVIPCEEIDEDILSTDINEQSRYGDHFFPDFGFKVECQYPDPSHAYYTRTPKGMSYEIISKFVFTSVPTSDDCIVVAFSTLIYYQGIFFCKPGDKSWTYVDPPHKKTYRTGNIIHFKDQLFYTLNHCGTTLIAYDLADLSSPKTYLLEPSFEVEPSLYGLFYLVESLGDILLVCRTVDELPIETFDVYRLDFSRNTWECAKCIGDQVLFFDNNQSLSLSVRDFPSLKANCIYFSDYPYEGSHDFGHYELGGSVVGHVRRIVLGKVFLPPWVMRHFH